MWGSMYGYSSLSFSHGSINDINIRFFMGQGNYHDYRYKIVATDYYNYALIYSCLNVDGTNEEHAYILSRTRNLDGYFTFILKNYLESVYSIDASKFQITDQDNCYYK